MAAKRRRFTERELVEWTKVVPIDSIRPHPRNPNNGDQERINGSLERHGQFRTVLLSEDGYLLAGNHTYHGKMEHGDKEIAVIQLPISHDDPQAYEIMVADNHITRKGRDDLGILASVLNDIVETQGEVAGAGFIEAEISELFAAVDPDFKPATESEQGKLDQLKTVKCPNCGTEFHPTA